MNKHSVLREFLKRHKLWLMALLVIAPLLVMLRSHYHSLTTIERTMPIANHYMERRYLFELARKLAEHHYQELEQLLALKPEIFTERRDEDAVAHFQRVIQPGQTRNPFALQFFIADIVELKGERYSRLRFYDPQKNAFVSDRESPRAGAVYIAASRFTFLAWRGDKLKKPELEADERDWQYRVVCRPITDHTGRVVGVTGLIYDLCFLDMNFLRRQIEQSLRKNFPDDYQQTVITVLDVNDRIIFSSQPVQGQEHEVYQPLSFIFKDWYLGLLMLHTTSKQAGRNLFITNLALSLVMALVLIGGVLMAIRTASQQMKLSQMKTDFVANVSHELRTPLASIRVFGEMMKLGRVKEQEKVAEYGAYIEAEGRRLTQLINNILDFSSIESGRKTYEFEQANLGEVVAETLDAFSERLKQGGCTAVFTPPEQGLPPVLIDTGAIALAITNLLDNAIKYSGNGAEQKVITLRLARTENFVTLAVADRGVGIAPEEREKIFDKFYRVSTGLTHDVKGSGLGLALVRHIAAAHRGRIEVASEPERGSVFTLWLPIVETERGA